MSTSSKNALMATIVARIKAYVNPVAFPFGVTVGTYVGDRIYRSQAPDDADVPYIVLRAINAQTDPAFNNTRVNFDLEVMVFGRPRSAEQTVETIADLVEQALLTWRESGATLGLSFARTSLRDTLPPLPDPANRELVQVRLLIECATWPRYLTTALVP